MERIDEENVKKVISWIEAGRGVAVWQSVDLSRPGVEGMTPASTDGEETTKPHWMYGNTPARVCHALDEFEVATYREHKRMRVAVRMTSSGLGYKCTDASSRKIRAAVNKAGPGSVYHFDYGAENPEVVISVPDKIVPLPEWRKAHKT